MPTSRINPILTLRFAACCLQSSFLPLAVRNSDAIACAGRGRGLGRRFLRPVLSALPPVGCPLRYDIFFYVSIRRVFGEFCNILITTTFFILRLRWNCDNFAEIICEFDVNKDVNEPQSKNLRGPECRRTIFFYER